MTEGERLIERLVKSRSGMHRALSRIDTQTEICPGWTIREILAHIAGWDKVGTGTVRAHLMGEQPPPLETRGIDAYNAYVVAGCETLTYPADHASAVAPSLYYRTRYAGIRGVFSTSLGQRSPDYSRRSLLRPRI